MHSSGFFLKKKPLECIEKLYKYSENALALIAVHEVLGSHFIATTESRTVIFLRAVRNARMAVLIPIVHVRTTVILSILPCAFNPIVKSSLLDFAELPGRRIPRIPASVPVLIVADVGLALRWPALQVRDGYAITAPESLAVLTHRQERDRGAAKFVVIIGIETAAVLNVAARNFQAIMEALPLNFMQFARNRVPCIPDHFLSQIGRRRRLLHSAIHQVRDGHFIAAAEAIAILFLHTEGDMGMAEFIAIVHIRIAMALNISACGFDAIVEALALDIVELTRGLFPLLPVLPDTRC